MQNMFKAITGWGLIAFGAGALLLGANMALGSIGVNALAPVASNGIVVGLVGVGIAIFGAVQLGVLKK